MSRVAPPSSAAGPSVIQSRTRGYLPHWEREQGLYFVTFRLADSIPANARAEVLRLKTSLQRARDSGRELLGIESATLHRVMSKRMEAYLDAGSGECVLRKPRVAQVVVDSLCFADDKRYVLHAWCVMPNHVHVLVQPSEGESLAAVVGGWKSFTARRINAVLERGGTVWQREYYDHLIRNQNEFERAVEYIVKNPLRAGLIHWKWVYVRGEVGPAAEDGGATL